MNAPNELALAKPAQQTQGFSLAPRNFDEAMRLADVLADSELVPKDFRGKPANCLIAVQWGAEIGLQPLQALQGIAVVNGRPSLWGDALIALVRNSPLCEYVMESMDEHGTAVCQVKRRGEPEQVRTFGDADAKQAGLFGKQGPWSTNPKRMKQMRARAFALRDVFPDVLKGMQMAEEVMDFTETLQPATPAKVVTPAAPKTVALDHEILAGARTAADKGREAFAQFWKAATPDQRRSLKDEVGDLQRRTDAADKARTVDAEPVKPTVAPGPTEAPAVPADDPWLADLNAAEGSSRA